MSPPQRAPDGPLSRPFARRPSRGMGHEPHLRGSPPPYLPGDRPPRVRRTHPTTLPGYGKTPGEGVVRRAPEADRPGVLVHGEAGQVVRPAARGRGSDPAGADRSPGADR